MDYKYAFEVAENLSLEAMKQSEEGKIKILGKYYSRQFYYANSYACIEINILLNYGMWSREKLPIETNNTHTIQIKTLIPTIAAKDIYYSLSLEDIPIIEVKKVIKSLQLNSCGCGKGYELYVGELGSDNAQRIPFL